MGYSTREHALGTTTHFWPDDTDTEFYIEEGATMLEIMNRCFEKFPGFSQWDFANIRIDAEFVHTDCLGYDLMDWGDYIRFLRITNTKKG